MAKNFYIEYDSNFIKIFVSSWKTIRIYRKTSEVSL